MNSMDAPGELSGDWIASKRDCDKFGSSFPARLASAVSARLRQQSRLNTIDIAHYTAIAIPPHFVSHSHRNDVL